MIDHACKSLASIVRVAHSRIVPFIKSILQNIQKVFPAFQRINSRSVCSLISNLIEASPLFLKQQQNSEIRLGLANMLLQKFNQIKRIDDEENIKLQDLRIIQRVK